MEKKPRYSVKSPGRGGYRPGSGRKPGSTTKIRIEDLIKDLESATNMTFTERVALNYALAINRSDWARVENYDRALLNKMVADRQEIELTQDEDQVAVKQQAFAAALAAVAGLNQDAK
jgi:hypothetical protein